jgi:hypothetical protein
MRRSWTSAALAVGLIMAGAAASVGVLRARGAAAADDKQELVAFLRAL